MDMDISLQSNRIWFDRLTQDIMMKSTSISILGGDGFSVDIPLQWLTGASPMVKSILSAPASNAFSKISLTTDAGLSTTSPAAIWLASLGLRI